MEIHLAFLQLFFFPIFCNEILHGRSNEVSLKNETEDFEDFKAFTLKKIGELEYDAFNLKEENRILREKVNVIEQDGETQKLKNLAKNLDEILTSVNTTSGAFDYLYTRVVELMTCVNDLKEMATKVCFQPRPTPDGLRILPEPQFKLPATVKAVRKLNMFEN